MSKSQKKFTKFMALSVATLGMISTALLLTDPPVDTEVDSIADIGPSVFELNSSKLKQLAMQQSARSSERGIASVDAEENRNPSLIEVKCEDTLPAVETAQTRLRLKGENCFSEKTTSTTIKNNSNGYIATVFHKADFSFTTDYINLAEGENSIAISFETPQGQISKTLTINRTPASDKNSKN